MILLLIILTNVGNEKIDRLQKIRKDIVPRVRDVNNLERVRNRFQKTRSDLCLAWQCRSLFVHVVLLFTSEHRVVDCAEHY